jgi:hypothetical protein
MERAAPSFDAQRYAAIIGKRAEYYLPRFERFARGGYFSWNWPAFINTLAWLRYRKLYAWSWLYFFLSPPLLLSLLAMHQFTDPCQRALAAPTGEVVLFVFWTIMAVGFVGEPVFANRIYFDHIRSLLRAADVTGTTGTYGPSSPTRHTSSKFARFYPQPMQQVQEAPTPTPDSRSARGPGGSWMLC